jgi:hypothetical protein
MRSLRLISRLFLGTAASTSLLAGCSALPPSPPNGALPQTSAVRTPADGTDSWMLPEAKSQDLLYAAISHQIDIFSYPQGRLVGELRTGYLTGGLCSDPEGDVFVDGNGEILEYAHAGKNPIATVKSQYGYPLQCAFDPTTGNLAVIDTYFTGPDNIAVYQNVTGKAEDYYDYGPFYGFYQCTYDGTGDLFVTGYVAALGELPNGGNAFVNYKPALKTDNSDLTGIAWDGTYVTVQEVPASKDRALLDRITIAHKKAKVVSRTRLDGSNIGFRWLYSGAAIGLEGKYHHRIGFWRYPAGGGAVNVLRENGKSFDAITISVAP